MIKFNLSKALAIIILFLTSVNQLAYPQKPSAFSDSNIEIRSQGLLKHLTKTDEKTKTTIIYTIGGFVNLDFSKVFIETDQKVYSKTYLAGDGEKINNRQKFNLQPQGNEVYLHVNSSLFLELLSLTNDSLVKRYQIKRIPATPKLQLKFVNQIGKPTTTSETIDSQSADLEIPPGKTLLVGVLHQPAYRDLAITYQLVNLNTKKTVSYSDIDTSKPIQLDEGATYQLSWSYDVQKESKVTIRIMVKPYWYKSAINYLLILVAVVVTIAILIWIRLRRKVVASQNEQHELAQAALRLQSTLNPHFTFNALSTIQGLMNTDRIEEANLYLEEFSSLLRKTLSKSQQVFNSLDQELEMMRVYIKLEALRFNFSWEMQISPLLQLTEIDVPTLLMQPLIENSIKHGLSKSGQQGQLLITCKPSEQTDTFIIIIQDNGTWASNQSTAGYGLSLTYQRIETINQMKDGQKITLEFDKVNGTTAIFTFHHWLNN